MGDIRLQMRMFVLLHYIFELIHRRHFEFGEIV